MRNVIKQVHLLLRSSSLLGSMQEHMICTIHQPANGGTSPCATCIKSYHWFWLLVSFAGRSSLMRMSRDPVGHHWFWLPASYACSPFLLKMFTGPMPQLHFESGAFSSSSSSSSLPGSMQEHMRCTCQPATAKPQLHLWAIIGSGYQPAFRAAFRCCRCQEHMRCTS